MQLITKELLDDYLQEDSISPLMDRLSEGGDEALTCQRWLRESPPKRLLFELLYGGLLDPHAPRQGVLDVGGGLTALHVSLPKDTSTSLLICWPMTILRSAPNWFPIRDGISFIQWTGSASRVTAMIWLLQTTYSQM